MNKISVVVPIYNVERYLKRCIDSIINQTYDNLEIILVNDGSKDSCLNICNEYKKKDERVIVIDQPNAGLSGARNSGIEIATGEYISFIDSDDYIHKDFYKEMLSTAVKEKSDNANKKIMNILKIHLKK